MPDHHDDYREPSDNLLWSFVRRKGDKGLGQIKWHLSTDTIASEFGLDIPTVFVEELDSGDETDGEGEGRAVDEDR